MWTREKVRELATSIGYHHQFTSGELNSLHTILSPDEECCAMTEGMMKKVHVNKHSGYGIAVLTDKRFLFYHKGFWGSLTVEEFPIETISSISLHQGPLFSSLHIYASHVDEIAIEQADHNNASTFVRIWKHLVELRKIFESEPESAPASDPIAELEKWHAMKEKGVITEDEFNLKKKQIMGL